MIHVKDKKMEHYKQIQKNSMQTLPPIISKFNSSSGKRFIVLSTNLCSINICSVFKAYCAHVCVYIHDIVF